jgi:xanthine dehydrogenase YagT iron-sulfur-binding subunit
MAPKDDFPDRAKDDRVNVSRRNFLKTAGVGSLATAVTSVGVAEVAAQTGPAAIGPGDVPVTLTVNGKRLDLRIEPRVTLLNAIRNRADLVGNKRVATAARAAPARLSIRTVIPVRRWRLKCREADSHGRPGQRRDAAPGAAGVRRH